MKQILKRFSVRRLLSLMFLLAMVGNVWGEDQTLTEDFEKQSTNSTYNSQQTYTAANSNAGIGWYVEHGCVSTTGKLTGSNSMHMRAYYQAKSSSTTWNGALPYVYSTTAVKGLKSISFNAAASNTGIKYDTYYSTDGSTWTAIQTGQSLTTSSKSYSFDIPNSSASTSYYIKIATSSSSTHAASPTSNGNYTFRVDDIVFTYTVATKTLSSIAISGTPTKTTYEAGEALNPAGLVVTGTYSDSSKGTITEGIDWALDPETLTAGATTCDVMASVGSIDSEVYTVTGLTVTAAKSLSSIALSGTPTKTAYTVGECFDPAGITVTANYGDGTNENVTSSATFYGVTEALTAGQISFETYATYKGVDSDVQNYTITVSKKTPTITIANMTISKDEQATISATTTPAEASLTFTITEGSEYITLNGSTITGVAAGTATVRASYAGNAEYDALDKDFTVTVTNDISVEFTPNSTNCANVANISVNAYLSIACAALEPTQSGQTVTAPNFNTQLRINKNNTITFQGTTGTTISKIELTYSSSSNNGKGLTTSSGTYTYDDEKLKATWTGDPVNSVTLTPQTGTSNAGLRITGIKIYYVPGAVQQKELLSLILSGTQKTQYEVNETFSIEGLVVNGYYNDDTTSPIEAGDYNVTAPDMTSAGVKDVTVAVGEVSKTYTVAIYNASAVDYTLDMTTATYDATPTADLITWTKENITVKAEKNESTNVNNYIPGSGNSSTRLYKNNILTFTPSDATIARIIITTTTENYASALSSTVWTNAKAMAEGTSVTMIPTNGPNAISGTLANTTGIETIKFYYESATATITLNAACTDGSLVYGTYSNSSAWVVPSDLDVSVIGVDGNALCVEPFKTGDVVPANTGVMVSALEGGNYTINLSNKAGADPLEGAYTNALRPTGKGINAEQMVAKDPDCKYYRLTMHNKTQIGFWYGAADGAGFTLGANKAYLAVPKGSSVKAEGLWINGDETAISQINNEQLIINNGTFGNGRNVFMQNGRIVIVKNGKKYNTSGQALK